MPNEFQRKEVYFSKVMLKQVKKVKFKNLTKDMVPRIGKVERKIMKQTEKRHIFSALAVRGSDIISPNVGIKVMTITICRPKSPRVM